MKRYSASLALLLSANAGNVLANTCGNGRIGDEVCPDENLCCSQYGWCGTSDEHCQQKTTVSPTTQPTTPGHGSCGNGNRGDGVCSNGTCCSPYGWCGHTSHHCSGGPNHTPTRTLATPKPTSTTPLPTPLPTSLPTSPPGMDGCGFGIRGDGICADGTCCSKYGWCGTGAEFWLCPPGPTPPTSAPRTPIPSIPTPPTYNAPNPLLTLLPTPPTTFFATPQPTDVPTPPPRTRPTAVPTTPTAGSCGNGNRGNGICADENLCCSQFGWCGTSSDYCSGPPTPTSPSPTLPSPTSPPPPVPTPGTGSCGYGMRGDGVCDDGACCSQYGWCGTGEAFWLCQGDPPPAPIPRIPPTPLPTISTPPPTPPSPIPGTGTCGNGDRGDGICSDENLCCSPYGWCGTSDTHCSGNPTAPTPTPYPPSGQFTSFKSALDAKKSGIDNKILLYKTPSSEWIPSSVYRYNDFIVALRVMHNEEIANNAARRVMQIDQVEKKSFYVGDSSPGGVKYGLVNVAAFLAQSMKESIQYNACDENSWDLVNGQYPLSNACGQLGQNYQDYKCSASEAHMECPVNREMEITATTNAKWYGAPAPLFCAPKTKFPFTGYWDYSKECNIHWASPPETCHVYDRQLAGGFDNSSPYPSRSGRTDVEGCCFWGRGVIQTTGVCNFGKLNYYFGSRAAEEGRDAPYPNINFCERPDAICSEEHRELKWIAGMFYWVESLQSYNVGGWDYISQLRSFVDNGMSGNSFIDAVSGIVNRGCHNPPCASGAVDGMAERSTNFFKVLAVLDLV